MSTRFMRRLYAIWLVQLLVLCSTNVLAAYPERPIRWIIDVPAGTTSDLVARLVGQRMSESMGVPIIVESKPGASGAIAYAAGASAPPDGYTMVMITATLTQAAAFKAEHRPMLNALVPVAPLIHVGNVLVVRGEGAPANFSDFLQRWRQQKEGMSFASIGIASSSHLAGQYLATSLKLPSVHVPYTGTAPAFTDLAAGRLDFMFPNVPAAMPQLRSGRFKALAVSSATRATTLPDVPTLAELGLPKLAFSGWFGIAITANAPSAIVSRLNQEVVKAISAPDIRARLLELGAEPVTSTPEQFAEFVRNDYAKWGKIMNAIGIKPE